MRNAKAFTLIEVLSVIVIIVMLTIIGSSVYVRAKDGGKKTDELSQLKQIALAATMYHDQFDSQWPNNTGSLVAMGFVPKAMCKSPRDKTKDGLSNAYLLSLAGGIRAYKDRIAPFPNTYICFSDIHLYRREKMNALLTEQTNPGLFVSLIESKNLWPNGRADGPFEGRYHRALLDGSVVTREHRAFVGNGPEGKPIKMMSDDAWFFDPDEEWIRKLLSLE